ncbi:MAG: HNH endonuclease signature motif containing protein [Bacteroidia bacterium]|jgi:5-methylcytosine-specific restriction protein A
MPTQPKPLPKPWYTPPQPHERWYRDKSKFNYNSPAWRKLSKQVALEEPLCSECRKEGRAVPGEVTDHDKAIEDGGDPWARENLHRLCNSCHNSKSARERNARARNQP